MDSTIFVNNFGWTQAFVTHLFSFTDCHKWKQIRILHFTFFVHCAKSGFVTLYLPVCRVRRFAVEQSSFRNGSALRTEVDRSIAINLKVHVAFVKGIVYHDFSYYHISDHCVKVGSDLLRKIIKPSNVIGSMHLAKPICQIYHLVRCRNSDSSLVPYFLLCRLYG